MNELVKNEESKKFYGASDNISPDDFDIGRVIMLQKLSELVSEGDFKPGQFVDSNNERVLGNKQDMPFEFVPIYQSKIWLMRDKDRNIVRVDPARHSRERKWEDVYEGQEVSNVFVYCFYLMAVEDMKKGRYMPLQFNFSSTAIKAAKRLCTELTEMKMADKPSWDNIFEMTAIEKSKGKDTWFTPKIKKGRETTKEEREQCYKWAVIIHDLQEALMDRMKEDNARIEETEEVPF